MKHFNHICNHLCLGGGIREEGSWDCGGQKTQDINTTNTGGKHLEATFPPYIFHLPEIFHNHFSVADNRLLIAILGVWFADGIQDYPKSLTERHIV